jgi:hypothetical protein
MASLVPDADFVFGGRMHLQPNHSQRLRGRKSHHVREIGVQRDENAAVLDSKAQDLFVSRS